MAPSRARQLFRDDCGYLGHHLSNDFVEENIGLKWDGGGGDGAATRRQPAVRRRSWGGTSMWRREYFSFRFSASLFAALTPTIPTRTSILLYRFPEGSLISPSEISRTSKTMSALVFFNLAHALVVPPQLVVQQVIIQQRAPVQAYEHAASVFPSSSFFLASSSTDKIEAAKAAAAARAGTKAEVAPSTAVASDGKARVQKLECPDDATILSTGSGKSGKMVSKACSAQLGQKRAQAAKDAANAKKIAYKRAQAAAGINSLPSLPSLPKLPF